MFGWITKLYVNVFHFDIMKTTATDKIFIILRSRFAIFLYSEAIVWYSKRLYILRFIDYALFRRLQ